MKRDLDFHTIQASHEAIHGRLLNWARVVRVNTQSKDCAPMFHAYRSTEVWQDTVTSVPADLLDGWRMEKAVGFLPDKHRAAVRWHYVYRGDPYRQARKLGISYITLHDLVHKGRSMLNNRD